MNKDGYVTGTELGMYLNEKVMYYNASQTPQYGKIKDPDLDEGDFVFSLSSQEKQKAVLSISKLDPESEMWELVKNTPNVEEIRDFLNSFPNGRLSSVARLKIKQLERKKVASLPPPVDCCYLTVRSNVSRDMVYIDGVKERGTSKTPFKLDSGRYKIEVKKDGYETFIRMVSLSIVNPQIVVKAKLPKRADCCYLTVTSNVPQSMVSINGSAERATSERAFKLTPGRYNIEVNKNEYSSYTNTVYLSNKNPKIGLYAKLFYQESFKSKYLLRSADRRYTDNGNGVIKDTNTGLMWVKEDSYADLGKCLDWNASKNYVSRLNTGGYSDWRLPTVKELKGIIEKSKQNRDYIGNLIQIDPIFASGGAYWDWSSETVGSSRARTVSLLFGSVFVGPRDGCPYGGVRAVRR